MSREQLRRGNGRWRRTVMADFGITAWICAACRRFNPVAVGAGRPAVCHACAKPFQDLVEVQRVCESLVRFFRRVRS